MISPMLWSFSLSHPAALPPTITALCLAALGLRVLLQEPGSRIGKLFCLMVLLGSLWQLAFAQLYAARDLEEAGIWLRLAYLIVPLLPAALYHFSVTVLGIDRPRRFWIRTLWIASILWALVDWMVTDVLASPVRQPWGFYPRYGPAGAVFLLYTVGCIAASLRHYWTAWRRSAPGTVARQRAQTLLAAFAIASLSIVDTFAKFGLPVYPLSFLPILGFVLLTARAIQRFPLIEVTPEFAAAEIIDTMPDALLVVDRSLAVQIVNPATCDLLARTDRELVGQPLAAIDGLGALAQRLPTLRTSGAKLEHQVRLGREASERTLSISASVIPDHRGEPAAYVCIAKDLTAHQQAAEAARQYAAASAFADAQRQRADDLTAMNQRLQQANALLAREILAREEAQTQLRTSLREKDVLLREVHHRVKNNLQVISSLLSLQAEDVGDPRMAELFQESQNRIRSMAFLHERLYQSSDLAQIDMPQYLRGLIGYLTESYHAGERVRVTVTVEPMPLHIDKAIPCGLIVNELVSNALKHAFPNGRNGTVEIALRRNGAGCTLCVDDTGVGLPQELDFRNTRSLGMRLVVALTEQLQGTLERADAPGTCFRIVFPA